MHGTEGADRAPGRRVTREFSSAAGGKLQRDRRADARCPACATESNYAQAVALRARADALLHTSAERTRFDEAIEALRTGKHRRKTSLMGMLDVRGW